MKWGCDSFDKLDASTLSRGETHNRVTIWSSEWGNPSGGVGPLSGGNLNMELGSRLLPSGDVVHQRSCELGKDLKKGCDSSIDWMHRLRTGVGPTSE